MIELTHELQHQKNKNDVVMVPYRIVVISAYPKSELKINCADDVLYLEDQLDQEIDDQLYKQLEGRITNNTRFEFFYPALHIETKANDFKSYKQRIGQVQERIQKRLESLGRYLNSTPAHIHIRGSMTGEMGKYVNLFSPGSSIFCHTPAKSHAVFEYALPALYTALQANISDAPIKQFICQLTSEISSTTTISLNTPEGIREIGLQLNLVNLLANPQGHLQKLILEAGHFANLQEKITIHFTAEQLNYLLKRSFGMLVMKTMQESNVFENLYQQLEKLKLLEKFEKFLESEERNSENEHAQIIRSIYKLSIYMGSKELDLQNIKAFAARLIYYYINISSKTFNHNITQHKQRFVDIINNYPSELHIEAAFLAASFGNGYLIEFFYKNGIDVSRTNSEGASLLHYAVLAGNLQLTKYLVEVIGIGLEVVDKAGWTSLAYAAMNGDKQIVDYLLEVGANVFKKSSNGYSAWHAAFLSKNGLSYNHIAIINDFAELLNPNNQTLIYDAVKLQNKYMLKILMEHNIRFHEQLQYQDPLAEAVKIGNSEIAEILFESVGKGMVYFNIDSINLKRFGGDTLLHTAVRQMDNGMINLLIKHKASTAIANDKSITPLLLALQNPNSVALETIIKNASDLFLSAQVRSVSGCLPVHVAVEKNIEAPLIQILAQATLPHLECCGINSRSHLQSEMFPSLRKDIVESINAYKKSAKQKHCRESRKKLAPYVRS